MITRRSLLGAAGATGVALVGGCAREPEIDRSLEPPAAPGDSGAITFQIWDKA